MAQPQLPLDHVKAALIQNDEAFRQLVLEHHALDERIRLLTSLTLLSSEQQYLEHELKKQKLLLKDRIEAVVREHGFEGASA
jgi:uncharacterized protein YdcH (DUF465 family)